MKKGTIAFIISFASVALVGIIIIQVFWMNNALRLQEELFNNRVNVALKGVVNRMFDEKITPVAQPFVCSPDCDHRTTKILTAINPVRLDSLLHEEFHGMEITREYAWGVFDPDTKRFFAGQNGELSSKITQTDHAISLSCLFRNEKVMMGVYFPQENKMLLMKILPWMLLSLLFMSVVIIAFSYMIFSFIKQKKLSDIKSDFVNNMTHELKTPISTISLASEMLLKSNGNLSEEKKQKYTRMIYEENARLQQQVEQVLQIAVLEKGSFKMELTTFDAHEVISRCIMRFELAVKNANGQIVYKQDAKESIIEADIIHFQNIVCNMLDNAVKYSGKNPDIMVSTSDRDRMLIIEFKDKGMGISHENHKMIFDKLYRVSTGNLHDVKGFGLGLYYVKTITEALGGQVRVHSEINKGSTFEISLPLKLNTVAHE